MKAQEIAQAKKTAIEEMARRRRAIKKGSTK